VGHQTWALRTPYVHEVRLFGSRARGNAKPDSDIDLAITVGGDNPGVVLGIYFALGKQWQDKLSELQHIAVSATVIAYGDGPAPSPWAARPPTCVCAMWRTLGFS